MNESLIVTSLQTGKILVRHGQITLFGRGNCMYPTIRYRDRLHIKSATVSQAAVGEIAVCRRAGILFAHRIIGKEKGKGKPFIITRADNTDQGHDPPTYDKDLLGIVAAIERNGRQLQPGRDKPSGLQQAVFRFRLTLLEAWLQLRCHLLALIRHLQDFSLYQQAARVCFRLLNKQHCYTVHLPFRANHNLFQTLDPDHFIPDIPDPQNNMPTHWSLALHLGAEGRPAVQGFFSFCPTDKPEWQLTDVKIRLRYRGCGLKAALLNRAERIFQRSQHSFRV